MVLKFFYLLFYKKFLASAITLLKRCNLDSSWAIDAELLLRMSTQACLEKLSSSRPVPPSSQANAPTKTFVMGEQFCPVMPILEADKRVQKLQNLLMEDFRNSENEFDRLLSECAQNPKIFIADRSKYFLISLCLNKGNFLFV